MKSKFKPFSSNIVADSVIECHFPLIEWAKGTDLLKDMLKYVEQRTDTLTRLYQLKQQNLLFPKPTLSTRNTFTFWIANSISNAVLSLPGIFGGSSITINSLPLPNSSRYKGKKQSPRPRRVLLDIGVDQPELVKKLLNLGLEVITVWDSVSDLVQYEIIDMCTSQYIDLLVTKNSRMMTSSEEWLQYLMPHRTKLYCINSDALNNYINLSHSIYSHSNTKRRKKIQNHPISLDANKK